ncbi:MAG: hypothetical protein ACC645_28300 [Pirellulales bacterium]
MRHDPARASVQGSRQVLLAGPPPRFSKIGQAPVSYLLDLVQVNDRRQANDLAAETVVRLREVGPEKLRIAARSIGIASTVAMIYAITSVIILVVCRRMVPDSGASTHMLAGI